MTQWLAFGLMTVLAVFIVIWPLGRRRPGVRAGDEVAVYKDQLEEVARDRAAGLLGEAEAQAARVEVSRRLLHAAEVTGSDTALASLTGAVRRRWVAAIGTLLMLPIGAGALYVLLGSPELPAEPFAARPNPPAQNRSIENLIAQVEAHLERNPDDGRGWQLLAPVYMRLGRFDDAAKAFRQGLRLLGDSAERQADLGEALVSAANGVVTAEAASTFNHALALDAHNLKARFFAGVLAEQDGKPERAAVIWRDILREAPSGATWTGFVRDSLARVDPRAIESTTPAPTAAPGARPSEVAAAADLSPEQRAEMIRAMVGRLAERLSQDGADVAGWLRLVRSYVVLGERDKAQNAASDARRALSSTPDNVRRIDELVKELGLDG